MSFSKNDKVRFKDAGGKEITGFVVRVNKKTVTVTTRKLEGGGVPVYLVPHSYISAG